MSTKYVEEVRNIASRSGGEPVMLRTMEVFQKSHNQTFWGRSDEFDEHRHYQTGDDTHDIDWRASAKTGTVLVKKFKPNKEQTLILAADIGRDMAASSPSGQLKYEVLRHSVGLAGLLGIVNKVEFQAIYGSGTDFTVTESGKEDYHLEVILRSLAEMDPTDQQPNNIGELLSFTGDHVERGSLIILITEFPRLTRGFEEILAHVCANHTVIWLIIEDTPLLTNDMDLLDGYDINSGHIVKRQGIVSRKLLREYNTIEKKEQEKLASLVHRHRIFHGKISGSYQVVPMFQSIAHQGGML